MALNLSAMRHRAVSRTMATLMVAITIATLGACSSTVTAGPRLGISNGTGETVTLAVNGARIADYPTGSTVSPVAPSLLPGLPWRIEVRRQSGEQLLIVQVTTPDQAEIDSNSGNCGTVTVWTGSEPSTLPTAAPPVSPGETCSP
jgi:hypothetical protein